MPRPDYAPPLLLILIISPILLMVWVWEKIDGDRLVRELKMYRQGWRKIGPGYWEKPDDNENNG